MCKDYVPKSMPGGRQTLIAVLEAEQGSAYVLRPDLSLEYVNAAWRRFARENGAPGLDSGWDTCVPVTHSFRSPLRELFTTKFEFALQRNQGWSHRYECSSPDVYRKFNMQVKPTAERDGLIVVHSLVVESQLTSDHAELEALAVLYRDARGLIVQCSSCGRVREPASSSWHWAPGLVGAERENVSHGICVICNFQYYA